MLRSAFIVLILISTPLNAFADSGNLNFSLGYSFLYGFDELKDIYKKRSEAESKDNDVDSWSLGITFQPYLQFKNGFRIGAGAGPVIIIFNDADHIQIPANISFGYSVLSLDDYTPYFRAGISYHFADGDFLKKTVPGFFCGIGMELFKQKPLQLGLEAIYDAAEVEFEKFPFEKKSTLKVAEFAFYIYADF